MLCDNGEVEDKTRRPILSGLIALVAVTAVVSGLLAVAALAGTRVLGLTGQEVLSTEATADETLFLPLPSPTPSQPAAPRSPNQEATREPDDERSEQPESPIQLEAEQDVVGSFEEIELFGTYRGGAGATLQVQRRQGDDDWEDFPVDVSVDGREFDTTVQTSRTGVNQWRVVDLEADERSNVVEVRVR